MADLSHTLVSRHAAARIIMAATNLAAEHNILNGALLQAYLELCQDADLTIRKQFLLDARSLLGRVDAETAESTFFPEVMSPGLISI